MITTLNSQKSKQQAIQAQNISDFHHFYGVILFLWMNQGTFVKAKKGRAAFSAYSNVLEALDGLNANNLKNTKIC
ncbi:MAG: hypothetical protein ACPGEC_06385 [Flavobacteriales bacterium]